MWFATIFRRKQATANAPSLFDEAFLRRLERLSLQAQYTLRGTPIVGRHPSRQHMPATIFSDHRPYVSGDDPRYLDWHAYARQEHLLVRLGEIEQELTVSVILDTSQSMQAGESDRFRLALQLAGAMGYLALTHGDQVAIWPGDSAEPVFGPARGKTRSIELLNRLRALQPAGHIDLARVAGQLARRQPRGGIALIVSDLLVPLPMADLARMLPAPRWQVQVLHLLSQTDLTPTGQGPLELIDSETGERLEVDLDAETLAAYRAAVTEWRSGIARSCAARGIAYAPVMIHWPLEQQIIPFLRLRRFLT